MLNRKKNLIKGGGEISPLNTPRPIYLQHLCRYKFALKKVNKKVVLEIGCGQSYGSSIMSKKAFKVYCLDINYDTIKLASKKYKSSNLTFIQSDAIKLPFKSNFFDSVIIFEVIEHIKNPLILLKEISRVLRYRGFVILSTPNRILRLSPCQPPWNPYHIHEYSPIELLNLLKKIFSINEIYGLYGKGKAWDFEVTRLKVRKWNLKKRVFYKIFPKNIKQYIPKIIKKHFHNLKNVCQKKETLNYKKNEYNNIKLNDYDIIRQNFESIDKLDSSLNLIAKCYNTNKE